METKVPLLILFKLREKCQTLSGKLYNSTAGNIKGDNLVYIWLPKGCQMATVGRHRETNRETKMMTDYFFYVILKIRKR